MINLMCSVPGTQMSGTVILEARSQCVKMERLECPDGRSRG